MVQMHACIEAAQSSQAARGEAHRLRASRRGRFPFEARHAEKKAPFFSLSWASEKVIGNLETLLRIQCWGWRKRGRRFCLGGLLKLEYSVWPYKQRRKRKELFNASADGRAVHGRRCLQHGLCHGSQWPWLTSAMQDTSPDVARARGPLNSLHPLVSLGGANGSVCFLRELLLLWALPCNS